MLKLLQRSGTFELLKTYCREHPVWGICAGSILLAQEVVNPEQPSLGAIPVRAHRNFYGSQRESFCTSLEVPALGRAIPVDFIRAPHLEPMHPEVETLAMYEERHVIMKYDRALVSACHSELGTDPGLHEYFLSL
jgi:pyridoxal 5'-phosphate synthase pdxT subunit